MSRRKKAGLAVFVMAIVIAFSVPFLFDAPPLRAPEGDGGNNGDGNGGGNGKGNGNGDTGPGDTEAPQTTLMIIGRTLFVRGGMPYFYPAFTVALRATDNASLSMIILNDTGTPTVFQVDGTSAEVSLTVSTSGLHAMQYYSVDAAGNRETANSKHAVIARPELIDLIDLIENSSIDNDGIKNAMTSKVRAAQQQLDNGHELHSLNALVNQARALEGKHGLDSETVKILADMVSAIML